MRVLIHNQKGGVGKTTTAANLGAALARAGAGRVVVADLDPQRHLTAALGADADAGSGAAADWAAGGEAAPRPVPGEEGLFLLAGGGASPAAAAPGPVEADWLLVDSAPAWDRLAASLAAWADLVLCPLEPDFLGLSGVNRLLVQAAEAGIPAERVRLLLCRFNPRLAIHREVRGRLATRFPRSLLPVAVRASVRAAEAPGHGRTVLAHAPRSAAAEDYAALAALLTEPSEGRRRQDA